MERQSIELSVIKTLAYFGIMSHPLTKEELFVFLWQSPKINFDEFTRELDALAACGEIGTKWGFYFLSGREEFIEIRRKKNVAIERKISIARKAAKIASFMPFIQAFFVCNTVAFETADEDSDIDVFVVVKKGRIWIGRLLLIMFVSLFGLRRTKNKIKDKVCLSFYITDDNLNLKNISMPDPDIYLIYWIAQLVPLFDAGGAQEKFLQANRWVKQYLPNGLESYLTSERLRVGRSKIAAMIVKSFEKMWDGAYGNLIESQAKGIQQARMRMNLHSIQNAPDTRVVVSDSMLKFHENDRRQYYKEQWSDKIRLIV